MFSCYKNSPRNSDNAQLFVSPGEARHTIGVSFLFTCIFFRASFGSGDVLEEKYMIFL